MHKTMEILLWGGVHFLDQTSSSYAKRELCFRGLAGRMPHKLDDGVVIVQRGQPVLVPRNERKEEAEVVEHAGVWS